MNGSFTLDIKLINEIAHDVHSFISFSTVQWIHSVSHKVGHKYNPTCTFQVTAKADQPAECNGKYIHIQYMLESDINNSRFIQT